MESFEVNKKELLNLEGSEKQATDRAAFMKKTIDELEKKFMISITEQNQLKIKVQEIQKSKKKSLLSDDDDIELLRSKANMFDLKMKCPICN